MSLDQKLYESALRELSERRRAAEEEARAAEEEACRAHPELAALDTQMRATGDKLAALLRTKGDLQERLSQIREENLALQRTRARLLREAGYERDPAQPRYTCALCRDTGYISDEKAGREVMCDCLKREISRASVRATGIGSLIERETFDNFRTDVYPDRARARRNLAVCRAFAADPRGNLLLVGGTGLGKTHLSSAIAGVAAALPRSVIYETMGAFLSRFERERFGRGAPEGESALERYTACDLLILDDLGTEMVNSFTTSVLYEVLSERINRALPMVISTNLSPAGLQSAYPDSIVSRLLGEFTVLQLIGEDMRGKK